MAGRELTDKQRTWLVHVEDCAASGVPMRVYADRHGLDVQRFYVWKSQLKQLGVLAHDQAMPNGIDQPPSATLSLIRAKIVSRPSVEDQRQSTMCAAAIAAQDDAAALEHPRNRRIASAIKDQDVNPGHNHWVIERLPMRIGRRLSV
jgi:hypothetical protein